MDNETNKLDLAIINIGQLTLKSKIKQFFKVIRYECQGYLVKVYTIKRVTHKELNRTLEDDMRKCLTSALNECKLIKTHTDKYHDIQRWFDDIIPNDKKFSTFRESR